MPYEKALWKSLFLWRTDQTGVSVVPSVMHMLMPHTWMGGALEVKHPGGTTQRSLIEEPLPIQHVQGSAQFEDI